MDAKKHPCLAVLVGHHLGSWAPNPNTCELVDPFIQRLGNIYFLHTVLVWTFLVKPRVSNSKSKALNWLKFWNGSKDPRLWQNLPFHIQSQESTLMSGHLILPISPIHQLSPGRWSAGQKTAANFSLQNESETMGRPWKINHVWKKRENVNPKKTRA